MIDGQFLNVPVEITRYVQDDEGLFGGCQLVICGASVLHRIPPGLPCVQIPISTGHERAKNSHYI